MPDFNPYEAPQGDATPREEFQEGGEGIWRDGPLLVLRQGAWLPDRCVKCNAPAGGRRLWRKLSWHPPGWYILVLISVPIYIIAALIVRKTAAVGVGLCEAHWVRRRRALTLGWVAGLAGLGLLITGLTAEAVWLVIVGVCTLIAGLVAGVVASQTVAPARIDAELVWLKNVGPDFLAEFPDWGDFGRPPDRRKDPGIDDVL